MLTWEKCGVPKYVYFKMSLETRNRHKKNNQKTYKHSINKISCIEEQSTKLYQKEKK